MLFSGYIEPAGNGSLSGNGGHRIGLEDEAGVVGIERRGGSVVLVSGDVCGAAGAEVAAAVSAALAGGRDPTAVLDRFHGEFVVVVADPREDRVTVIASRFGIRPLFLHRSRDGELLVADDLGALASALVSRGTRLRPDRAYFACSIAEIPDDPVAGTLLCTPYEGVHQVPAGTWLAIGATTGEPVRYWRYWEREPLARGEAVQAVRAAFRRAVELRAVPGETGVMLSGGLDSGSVAAAAARCGPGRPPQCYTVFLAGDGSLDERRYATAVTSAIGAQARFLEASGRWAFRDVPDASRPPVAAPKQGWFYALDVDLAELAVADGVTVLLDGNGADDLFSGDFNYGVAGLTPWRPGPTVPLLPPLRLLATLSRAFPRLLTRPLAYRADLVPSVLDPDLVRELDLVGLADSRLAAINGLELDPMTKGRVFTFGAAATGAAGDYVWGQREVFGPRGLTWRHPYYDHRLVEAVFATPMDMQLSRAVKKPLLRAAVAPLLPATTLRRKFNANFSALVFEGLARERDRLVAYTEGPVLAKLGVVDEQVFHRKVTGFIDDDSPVDPANTMEQHHIWNMLVCELWLRDHAERAHLLV